MKERLERDRVGNDRSLQADGPRLRLLIADDHTMFADALRLVVEGRFEVAGVVGDGLSLVAEANRLKPDVIVVDIGMPLLNGFDAAQRVRATFPKVKIVFLTMQDDPVLAAAASSLGCAAFILKRSAASELMVAIEHVLNGKSYITPKLRAEDWVEEKARVRQFSKELTLRQREIIQMCAEGRPIKEIAGHLNLSKKTIEFHKHHIMEMYALKNNADIVLFALKLGLIPLPSKNFHSNSPVGD
jgi:DNA-binding NarL/FixJ family response regulator